jgi:hypothetical protein
VEAWLPSVATLRYLDENATLLTKVNVKEMLKPFCLYSTWNDVVVPLSNSFVSTKRTEKDALPSEDGPMFMIFIFGGGNSID